MKETPSPGETFGEHVNAWNNNDDELYTLMESRLVAANNLSDVASANVSRANLGLEIGVDVQAFHAYLADIAGLTPVANNLIGWNAAGTDLENKSHISVETDFIPISRADDGGTPPAVAALITSTNKALCRAFDGIANEDLKILWTVPEDIDTSAGIKFSVVGYVGSAIAPADTEVIAFSLAGISLGNSDIMSGAVGTAQTSSLTTDATYVQYDKLETSFSTNLWLQYLAGGETAHLDLIRLATTTDTYAQDFHVAGVKIKYQRLNNDTF